MLHTPLYERHRSLGARFVEFGGWEMPVQYSGILEEHQAVRQHAGLFDVSHMGEIELRGPAALAAAQELTVNDVSRLSDGQAQYSLLCYPSGGVVDDILVFRLSEQRLMLCVNASNIEKDFAWIRDHAGGAEVIDRSAEYGLLALQGPQATTILSRLTSAPLDEIPPFHFRQLDIAGASVMASRTGYTGEDGWEIYCEATLAPALWDALLEAGADSGLLPAGLGARDTLRLERSLPLYGHELDDETTPLEARLDWVVRFAKSSFLGRDALWAQKESGLTRRLTGLIVTGRGIARQGYPLFHQGERVGVVTSGTLSPTLGKPIAMGYVATRCADPGRELEVEIRGRKLAAETVKLPFYRR